MAHARIPNLSRFQEYFALAEVARILALNLAQYRTDSGNCLNVVFRVALCLGSIVIGQCLGYKNSVEWIFVMKRQVFQLECILSRKRQELKSRLKGNSHRIKIYLELAQ